MAWNYWRSPTRTSFGNINAPSPNSRSFGRIAPIQRYVTPGKQALDEHWRRHAMIAAQQAAARAAAQRAQAFRSSITAPQLNLPSAPPINLPPAYPREVLGEAVNQMRATAAQAANMPYLMKRFTRPGVSQSAATIAAATPLAAQALAQGEQAAAQQLLAGRMANAQMRLAASQLGMNRQLATAQTQAELADLANRYRLENLRLALQAAGPATARLW